MGTLVAQIALSRPELSLRYIRDGREELHTPGDGKLLSAIYAARGRDFAMSLVPVEGAGENVSVRGYVTTPLACRGSRAMETFFCCGRMIRSPLLTAALEEAYANRQLKGKFPGCVLHVDLPLHMVDVNVHPAKTVVKFVHERAVFSAVHHVVKDALDAAVSPAPQAKPASVVVNPRGDFYQTMDAKTFREQGAGAAKPAAPAAPVQPSRPRFSGSELGGRVVLRDSARPVWPAEPVPAPQPPEKTSRQAPIAPSPFPLREEPEEPPVPESPSGTGPGTGAGTDPGAGARRRGGAAPGQDLPGRSGGAGADRPGAGKARPPGGSPGRCCGPTSSPRTGRTCTSSTSTPPTSG